MIWERSKEGTIKGLQLIKNTKCYIPTAVDICIHLGPVCDQTQLLDSIFSEVACQWVLITS